MKKLAIFDLDGTLFQTEEINFCAYRQALEEAGHSVDEDYFKNTCNGRHYKVFLPEILGEDIACMEQVHQRKKELYASYLQKAIPNEHLLFFIKHAGEAYHLALVTTASRKNTLELLGHFGLEDYFELIVTQEDIKCPKPDPEGFFHAMEHFGAKGEDTVIFEDSPVGIEAARKTGASVMVVDRF